MCMKSVNINSVFYDNDSSELGGLLQFGKVINEVASSKDFDGNQIIENLVVVTYVSALSSEADFDLTKKYELLWQFGTIVNGEFVSKSVAKDFFDTEVNKTEQIQEITCKSFTNRVFKFTLRNYVLSGLGDHYLKVYIREVGNDTTWQIQSMNKIYIK